MFLYFLWCSGFKIGYIIWEKVVHDMDTLVVGNIGLVIVVPVSVWMDNDGDIWLFS